ncbi:hypothetical protein E5673_10795 [Sphingomonas sp. PAMC26645]|uniref:hypothetical protein n=1 Tax=Sphingomonas sp. PAMC26645 TaxID=2565555 RepID=UPI00109E274F|nr:hypothetical protein [Sphingomonas sp. PAMC26645]QCB42653.1 hypothetical protein E5673_10795 [Sphingomonas sp. PAMC26645]
MNAVHTEMLYFQRRLAATQVMAAAAAGPCARVAHETLAGLYADTLATLAAKLACLIAEPPLTFASRALRPDRSVGLRVLRTAMPRSRLTLKLAC